MASSWSPSAARTKDDAADARAEQVPVRRLLLVVLRLREARPFQKVQDGHGKVAVALAGLARRRQVRAAFLGMLRQILGRVAAHERKLQRPAGLADDRRPEELALQKKADERRAAVKGAEEREDVDPREVIADDEVVTVRSHVVADARDLPFRRQHAIEDSVVAAPPIACPARPGSGSPACGPGCAAR